MTRTFVAFSVALLFGCSEPNLPWENVRAAPPGAAEELARLVPVQQRWAAIEMAHEYVHYVVENTWRHADPDGWGTRHRMKRRFDEAIAALRAVGTGERLEQLAWITYAEARSFVESDLSGLAQRRAALAFPDKFQGEHALDIPASVAALQVPQIEALADQIEAELAKLDARYRRYFGPRRLCAMGVADHDERTAIELANARGRFGETPLYLYAKFRELGIPTDIPLTQMYDHRRCPE